MSDYSRFDNNNQEEDKHSNAHSYGHEHTDDEEKHQSFYELSRREVALTKK
jgi:hypothetical protein